MPSYRDLGNKIKKWGPRVQYSYNKIRIISRTRFVLREKVYEPMPNALEAIDHHASLFRHVKIDFMAMNSTANDFL